MKQGEASISKIKYRGRRKLDMGKPFAFYFFLGFGFGSQSIGNEMEDGRM